MAGKKGMKKNFVASGLDAHDVLKNKRVKVNRRKAINLFYFKVIKESDRFIIQLRNPFIEEDLKNLGIDPIEVQHTKTTQMIAYVNSEAKSYPEAYEEARELVGKIKRNREGNC